MNPWIAFLFCSSLLILGTTTGYSIQAMGGVAFRWKHIGFYTAVKYQANKTSDVDASGTGLFAGMSVHF